MNSKIQIGDPVPWFDALTIAGASINLGVKGGRWIILCFFETLTDPALVYTLAQLLGEADLFDDDHMTFLGVLTEPVQDARALAGASHKALGFVADFDQKITELYGAIGLPRMLVIDPMLRLQAEFTLGANGTDPTILRQYIRALPKVDDYAGVALTAPALIVPHIFDPDTCAFLTDLYDRDGGTDSGFMIDEGGKTRTVIAHNLKSRRDFVIKDLAVRDMMRGYIARRLVPMIERFFHYRPTRMDRYLVSCYDAEDGGHFYRHRDNVNAGARHRRFAVSINLNSGYDGCELIFPEFGRRRYVAPVGGAIVFSTGALHQVLPVTRGRRYAFVPFLYGEEDVVTRLANNTNLQHGELVYTGTEDELFPSL